MKVQSYGRDEAETTPTERKPATGVVNSLILIRALSYGNIFLGAGTATAGDLLL
jgi:hypothetical protein